MAGKYKFCRALSLKKVSSNHWFTVKKFIFSLDTSENIKDVKTLFNENALQNLHFPSVDLGNLKKFEKKYLDTFKEEPSQVSILAYDALGLIYNCWINNNTQFKPDQLYNKNGFMGLHGEFIIKDNLSKHQLKVYRISDKKFIKVY